MIDTIYKDIDSMEDEIITLGTNIYENPELAFEEYKSSEFCKELLKKHDFEIEDKVGNLDTAFKARYKGKPGGVTVAFLAEYDALPNMGHACGHNLIASTSIGAAIGLSKSMKDIVGEILVIGTPAEEGGGGKILLLNEGVFDEVDYALMTHPSTVNLINRGGLATTRFSVTYKGKPAHSASPERGINALQGVIQTFNLVDSLRAQMPNKTNINGIITEGGVATNIIPEKASCDFSVRAATLSDLQKVIKLMKQAVRSVEELTKAKATISTGLVYSERYSNLAIDEVFKKHLESFGEEVEYPDPDAKIGSSDIGNVSLKMPAIHAYIKIDDEAVAHTKDFTEISNSKRAQEMSIKAAKSLAATAYEILTDEVLREEIDKEFNKKVPKYESLELE